MFEVEAYLRGIYFIFPSMGIYFSVDACICLLYVNRFGHLVDLYSWNPHCRYLDGLGPSGISNGTVLLWYYKLYRVLLLVSVAIKHMYGIGDPLFIINTYIQTYIHARACIHTHKDKYM